MKAAALAMLVVAAIVWPSTSKAAEGDHNEARNRADDITRPRSHMTANGGTTAAALITPSLAPTSIVLTDFDSIGRVEIERAAVTFGAAVAGEEKELPSALVIRVFSPKAWSLRLLPNAELTNLDDGNSIDWGRVQWKGRSARYSPLSPDGVVIASGAATTAGGELVTIDLRFGFGSSDPLGHYISSLRIALDVF